MGPETPLRIAGPADRSELGVLIAGFRDFLASDRPTGAEIDSVLGMLLEDDATEFLLAGEPAAGFAQIRYRVSVWNGSGAEDAWLEDVYVDGTARGRGLGRILMEGVLARVRARGCARIQLDANRENGPAVALYESLGFTPGHNPAKWGEAPDFFYTLDLD
ncbi:MAG: GNAT family N-acetyltransferase [Solirubrobacterales bacterium]|nr:GNAT family N-acetyltransferase [Solirubrobacterales bacterium]